MSVGLRKYLFFCIVALMRNVKYLYVAAFMMLSLVMHSQEADSVRHYSLDNSVVTSSVEKKAVKGVMTGNLTLDVEDLGWLPQIMGSADILKTFQLMPGVTAAGEMDSGIYLRGADPGQVSVLLDGARIYFPSHLLNFYSVFNSDHISRATMLKSGVSPSYGGGVSGVIDVSSPDELFRKVGGKVSAGIISSQATVSVPVGRKSSVRVSGRGTYVNALLKKLNFSQSKVQPKYGFWDGNLTWNFKPDGNNTISLNAYHSKDNLTLKMGGFSIDGNLDWTNSAASLSWDRYFTNDMKMKHVLALSRYGNHVRIYRGNMDVGLPSGITDFAYRGNFHVPFGQSSLQAGADYVFHKTKVQTPQVAGLFGSAAVRDIIPYDTHEFAAHAEYSKWFSFPLRINVGLRYGGAVTDGTFHSGLEPRLSITYDFRNNMRIRASAMRQMQYVNTVSVSGMGLPTDFLVPVTSRIKPQASSSASMGFSHSFMDNMFDYSAEVYYSSLENVLEFDGRLFDLFGGTYDTMEHILSGRGRNYGMEFMFKKNRGKVSGWISYTISRSLRNFPGIMDGMTFPSKHDRLHNLSCTANYSPSPRWTFSAVFIYGTGTAYTPPSGLYMVGETVVQEYGDHNSARMPDYHRLDLSATYDFPSKGRLGHSMNLSVYNVYARNNPLIRDIRPNYSEETPTKLNLALVGVSLYTLLPSVTYSLTF